MLADLATLHPIIIDVFNRASYVLGYDLWALSQEGPAEKLNQTEYTQPALLAAGFAIWAIWQKLDAPKPQFLAGHSLGEYTALVCAEALDFEKGIQLVANRGKYMQEAVPAGQGGMAAIIGLDEIVVNNICKMASRENELVSPANFNSIGQIVIAGQVDAVDRATVLAKEQGATLAIKLPVSVPSHCALMRPAADQLQEELKSISFKTPNISVIHNVDVRSYQDSTEIQNALIYQLYQPVRWVETIQFFISHQIPMVIESGPGKVLTGLNKRISKTMQAVAIEQPDSFHAALSHIGD